MDSMYSRDDELAVITPRLSEIPPQLPSLSNVSSCVAFGCGFGTLDLAFVRHCIANVKEFIAVEPDAACAAQLRMKLPMEMTNVKCVVHEETAQNWKGADHPVVAVLLIHFIYFLNPGERMAFYHRLMDSVLRSGGFVFVVIRPRHTDGEPSSHCQVLKRLNSKAQSELLTDRAVRDAMLSVGFELCYEKTYECHLNVEELDDAFLSIFPRVCLDGALSLELVRQTAQEVFGDSKKVRHDSSLGVFRKP